MNLAPIGTILSREVIIVKEKQIHLERRLGHNAAYASKVKWELENLPQQVLPSINVSLQYTKPFEMVYNFTFIDRRTTGDQNHYDVNLKDAIYQDVHLVIMDCVSPLND